MPAESRIRDLPKRGRLTPVTPSERAALRDALLAQQIAGDTLTPRESVVGNAEKLAAGDPDKFLGFQFDNLTAQSVMDDVAAVCGCSNDLSERTGPGVIDVELTLDALNAVADRIRAARSRGERVLIATGHPTGLMPVYMHIARTLVAGGVKLLTPRSGEKLRETFHGGVSSAWEMARKRGNRIRYLDGVGALSDGAHLYHTHESWPMEMVLDGIEPPDLVIADHGLAGAAIVQGVETLAFADVNDPALSVAKRRGLTDVVVPLDDNRDPERYAAMSAYLAAAAGA